MNGSIMGMTRAEITRKLDEIVDFAGVEKYLDTPVKRYSSGMIVRLGFAIAAHLDPEILVVDEVLAVGDAEFQKKAIGKMHDVANGQGRTVLFVSHNMAAVKSLCKTGVILKNGTVDYIGEINSCIDRYIKVDSLSDSEQILDKLSFLKPYLHINKIKINGSSKTNSVIQSHQKCLNIRIEGETEQVIKTDVMLVFKNKDDIALMTYAVGHYKGEIKTLPKGEFVIEENISLPKILTRGSLFVDMFMHHPMIEFQMIAPKCCILECDGYQEDYGFALNQHDGGLIGLEHE